MKNKNNLIIAVCLIGIILLIGVTLVLRMIKLNPKNQYESQINFVYNFVIKNYQSDKEKNAVNDGKYSSMSLFKDGKELNFLAEFDVNTDKLIHLCMSDGSKITDIYNEDITKEYIKEFATFKLSDEICEFNE